MDKKYLFILSLAIGIVAIGVISYFYSGTSSIIEYVALWTSISTACYAILAAPKERTEPYLRITPVLEKYSPIAFDKKNLRGLNIWIENVGYSNAKNIEVRCQLFSVYQNSPISTDAPIPLKDKGVFIHPLLARKERIQYQAVKDFESGKLLSQQLIIKTSYSNEDDKKQKLMKNKWLVKELEEELEETKTS